MDGVLWTMETRSRHKESSSMNITIGTNYTRFCLDNSIMKLHESKEYIFAVWLRYQQIQKDWKTIDSNTLVILVIKNRFGRLVTSIYLPLSNSISLTLCSIHWDIWHAQGKNTSELRKECLDISIFFEIKLTVLPKL